MKSNPVLYAQMEQYYQRFQQSKLSRPAFCKVEGLAYAQFCYWCKRLAKDKPARGFTQLTLPTSPTPLLVLELAGQARLEFYSPVEASFLRALLSQ
jgi:hypothetical protein